MQTVDHGYETVFDSWDIFEQQYYKINKLMLCFMGQWPYQSGLQRIVRTILIMFLTYGLLLAQILKLIDSWGDIDLFLECFSTLVTNVISNIKFLNFIINTKKIRKILDETRRNWKDIRYLSEMKILQKYGTKGRQFTVFYFLSINAVVTAWISVSWLPILLDYVVPLNQSRNHITLFQTDYKVDPNKYFNYILLHGSIASTVAIQMVVSIDTFYMSTAQHACAMIDILRFRIRDIIQEDEKLVVMLKPNPREDVYYQQIVPCIKKHKDTIEFIRLIESSCEWSLFIIIGLNMLVMSCTGSRAVAKTTPIEDVVRYAFLTIAQVGHLFCNTLPGQWIMDASSLIQTSAYNCKWYLMSVRSRKLIILLISRSVKPCTIAAGRIYVMSMENFCSVLQTSMSYFTLLTSMQ